MGAEGSRRAVELALRRQGVISAEQAAAAGMSRSAIANACSRGAWARLLAGVYLVDSELLGRAWSDLPHLVRLRAALLAHGPDAVAVLGTAARLLGLPGLPPDDGTVHLRRHPGGSRHQQPGVMLHTRRIPRDEIAAVRPFDDDDMVLMTSVAMTVADLARSSPRLAGVAVLDACLNAERLTRDDFLHVEQLMAGLRGAVDGRTRLAGADGRAASPLETRIRLIASDGGLPPHVLQHPVLDRHGRLLGFGDLAWFRPGRRVLVAEADGREWHDVPAALYRDRRRANDFSATGAVDMVRFTWADTERPAYVVSVLRTHLSPRS